MGYDRGDSFPFDFETNGIPFGSKVTVLVGDSFSFNFEPNGIQFGLKLNGKLSPRSYSM